MGDKVPFETYNLICRDLDRVNEEIKQLKNKYEMSGQKCTRGHVNNLPVKLWDCPTCTEHMRKEKEWLLTNFAQMYKDEYSGIDESIDDIKKNTCLQMDKELKQALKEG